MVDDDDDDNSSKLDHADDTNKRKVMKTMTAKTNLSVGYHEKKKKKVASSSKPVVGVVGEEWQVPAYDVGAAALLPQGVRHLDAGQGRGGRGRARLQRARDQQIRDRCK